LISKAFREAEVRDPGMPAAVKEDVGRLEVAVHDAKGVGVMDGAGDGRQQLGGCLR
jgi:hypothetical protein